MAFMFLFLGVAWAIGGFKTWRNADNPDSIKVHVNRSKNPTFEISGEEARQWRKWGGIGVGLLGVLIALEALSFLLLGRTF